MSSSAVKRTSGGAREDAMTPGEQLQAAKEILRREAVALWTLSNQLGPSMTDAVALLRRHSTAGGGSVIVTGMGKAGLIGQKIAATLASTGTRAHFLHPAEAFHGDLGRVHSQDAVLMLTQSGETAEVTQLLPSLREMGVPIVAVTASAESTVGKAAATVIELGKLEEACSLGLAPSTTTTAMLALGDALALVLSAMAGFKSDDFARFHPGGSLGRKLSRVDDCMRPLDECRVAPAAHTTRQVLVECGRPGRRTGAVMLTGEDGKLAGMFTDSDLARLFEKGESAGGVDATLDRPIAEIMAADPTTIAAGSRMSDAVALLARRKFSELPVVDQAGKPLGLVDVTDIVGWQPEKPAAKESTPTIRVFPSEDVYAAG
ncbi:MAG: KpsF/GutQ family sugar-phosphate isomerase [Planctomycetota bacterium]